MRSAPRPVPWILAAAAGCFALACGGSRKPPSPEPDPMTLQQRGQSRLSSESLDIHLRLHEGGSNHLPLAVVRLTNLTRAPIYPLLDRIALQKPGEEPRLVSLACDREIAPLRRLAPRGVHWCGDLANPRDAVDLPVALPEIPAEGSSLEFELLVPVIFSTGDPRIVRWGNLVSRSDWRLRLPRVLPPLPVQADTE